MIILANFLFVGFQSVKNTQSPPSHILFVNISVHRTLILRKKFHGSNPTRYLILSEEQFQRNPLFWTDTCPWIAARVDHMPASRKVHGSNPTRYQTCSEENWPVSGILLSNGLLLPALEAPVLEHCWSWAHSGAAGCNGLVYIEANSHSLIWEIAWNIISVNGWLLPAVGELWHNRRNQLTRWGRWRNVPVVTLAP